MIVVAVVAVIVIYIELRFVRGKKLGKKYVASRVNKDRAHNALHTTRAVRNKLRSDSVETIKADYMIQKAESALDDGDYDSCIDTCKRAREELLRCKREGKVTVKSSEQESREEEDVPEETYQPKVKTPNQAKDEKYLQAKFELNAARGDFDLYTGPPEKKEAARKLIQESERYFDEKEFTKALSCSFKARKIISGEDIETSEPAKPIDQKDTASQSIISGAAGSSAAKKCGYCGSIVDKDDTFCATCGQPVGGKTCSSCGGEMKPTDKFCRKCGAKN